MTEKIKKRLAIDQFKLPSQTADGNYLITVEKSGESQTSTLIPASATDDSQNVLNMMAASGGWDSAYAATSAGDYDYVDVLSVAYNPQNYIASFFSVSGVSGYSISGHYEGIDSELGKSKNEIDLVSGANISWDLSNGKGAEVTLGGNGQLDNPTNMEAGRIYILRVIQDSDGGHVLTYDSAYKFSSGSAPTLTVAGNAIDILSFYCDGTYMYMTTFVADLQ